MKTYFIVYKITNQLDGKIYVGSHKTTQLNDDYMGSGRYLLAAQKKYGIENFTKEFLFVFDNPGEMYAKEAEIVNAEFLITENTYNLKVGGMGGFDYINANCDLKERNKRINSNKDYASMKEAGHFARMSKMGSDAFKKKLEENNGVPWFESTRFSGKTHTEETKRTIGEKNSKIQTGTGNSQFGTRWVHSLQLKVSKKINKDAQLPEGWLEGRKIKF